MKKLLIFFTLCLLCVALTACSTAKFSDNPMVAKWALKYNEGKSQVLFNFESDGNLDVVVWHYDEEKGDLAQAEDHYGSYVLNPDAGTFTYTTGGETYEFSYELEPGKSLTVTYEDKTFTLPFIEMNYVIE